jgi:hypothetical protein
VNSKDFFKYSHFKLIVFLVILIGVPIFLIYLAFSTASSGFGGLAPGASPQYVQIIGGIVLGITHLPLLLHIFTVNSTKSIIITIIFDVLYVFVLACCLDYVRQKLNKIKYDESSKISKI